MDIETGAWSALSSQKSSNFRELSNFVYNLEKDPSEGKLAGTETFMFTNNTTVDTDYHNGKKSSPE